MRTTSILIFFGIIAHFASAQNTSDLISTARPSNTIGAGVLAHRTLQLETGFNFVNSKSTSEFQYPNAMLRFGLRKGIELYAMGSYRDFPTDTTQFISDGLAPVRIGTKFAVLSDKPLLPNISIDLNFAIPNTGKTELRRGFSSNAATLSLSKTFKDHLNITLNYGYIWFPLSNEVNRLTLKTGYRFYDRYSLYAEVVSDISGKQHHEIAAGGFQYILGNNIALDISGSKDLAVANNYMISLGLSARIGW